MKTVAIIGMGYVGKGMLRLFQKHYDVRWYDISTQPDITQVQGADLAVICVPTPQSETGACDTSIVEDVCSWVDAPLVLIKSTVPPGTVDKLNVSLSKMSDAGTWERFHFSPEYMGEPKNFVPNWKYPDPRNPQMHDFVIVGGPQAGAVMDFFTPVMGPHTRYMTTDAKTAELTKYMENSYFALKVSFVNEFALIAKAMNVDWHQLRAMWLLDPRVDPDHTQVFPGNYGWGGKCLPKDTAALCETARAHGHIAQLMEACRGVNERHRMINDPTLAAQVVDVMPMKIEEQHILLKEDPKPQDKLDLESLNKDHLYSGAQVHDLVNMLIREGAFPDRSIRVTSQNGADEAAPALEHLT